MIKGITVTLYNRTQTGTDDFNAPVYAEAAEAVPNVLVTPTASEEVVSEIQLYGRRSVYELCIPKGDAHDWENRRVSFFGRDFRTFGPVTEYIEANVPLMWNKKVKVEAYE